jgi:hypothetical protein
MGFVAENTGETQRRAAGLLPQLAARAARAAVSTDSR